MSLKITELFAFVTLDEEGDEGLMGFHTPDGWVPMIGADMARISDLQIMADNISRKTGIVYTLKKFKLASEEEFEAAGNKGIQVRGTSIPS
jgi:hypothetical protein